MSKFIPLSGKRFLVALSFPGARRDFVEHVAACLGRALGKEKVFYDDWYEHELARPDLDTYLQRIYHDDSELLVVFLSAEYDRQQWCGLEWRAVRDLIKRKQASAVMPMRFDDTDIPGLLSIDGYVKLTGRTPDEIAELIFQRVSSPGSPQGPNVEETPERRRERSGQGTSTVKRDPVAEIQDFNWTLAQQNPGQFQIKLGRMATSAYAFYRGTLHLFARDMVTQHFEGMPRVPGTDVEIELLGEVHSDNFGAFQAADRSVHYDISVFSEMTHGGFDFDVCRMATGMLLAAEARGDAQQDAVLATRSFLAAYCETMRRLFSKRQPLDIDVSETERSGCSALDRLIRETAAKKRSAFIRRRIATDHDSPRLSRSAQYFDLPLDERAKALRLLEDYVTRAPQRSRPDFFNVQDVCGRVAGIGHLGRPRYVILIGGRSKKAGRNRILEFKEARQSVYELYRQRANESTSRESRAERIIKFQRASQAACDRFLGFANDGKESFVVRELGPRQGRLNVTRLRKLSKLQQVARIQAEILARIHARSAARVVGEAGNPLAELHDENTFCNRILAFAIAYAELARDDFRRFRDRLMDLANCEAWAGSR